MEPTYQSVVIIGAPRSGTNMLRDVLTRLPGVATWPCDEINYIWRHGNVRYDSDEFPPELATPRVVAYIRRCFDRLATRSHSRYVVEKTCANSLRVGFVDRVVPDAKYIFICRNGLDVVASAAKRWRAPLDIPYLARKARYVPLSDLPYYASRYALNRFSKLLSDDRGLATWGPLLANASYLSDRYNLMQRCALQWQRCIERAEDDFSRVDALRLHRVRYEDFVSDPVVATNAILAFLQMDADEGEVARATGPVSSSSVGLGAAQLTNEQRAQVRELIGSTLHDLGYPD